MSQHRNPPFLVTWTLSLVLVALADIPQAYGRDRLARADAAISLEASGHGALTMNIVARFQAPRESSPRDRDIAVELVPPDPIRLGWRIFLPAACFEGEAWIDARGCGGSIVQFDSAGSQRDLARHLTVFLVHLRAPRFDEDLWTLLVEPAAEDLPNDAVPPDPIRGGIRLRVGAAEASITNRLVAWGGRSESP